MEELIYKYNEDDLGWVTDTILLSGSIFLEVALNDRGRVAIKKSNSEDGDFHVVEMSPITGPEFEYVIDGDAEGKYLKVVTSEKPSYIRITNI